MSEYSTNLNESTAVLENIKLELPPRYKVIFYNDDYTTMEFVVEVLVSIYHKNSEQAVKLMEHIHMHGSAVVGIYSYDIAKTKRDTTVEMARSNDFPLKVEVEKD